MLHVRTIKLWASICLVTIVTDSLIMEVPGCFKSVFEKSVFFT